MKKTHSKKFNFVCQTISHREAHAVWAWD